MDVSRFVALGDSQTEGLNDTDGRGGFRGWADRLAEILTVRNPHLCYANLAVRGRLLGAIRAEQLAPALAMRPDLATVMGGLNDILQTSYRVADAIGHLDAMLAALREAGATVLTNTFPDIAPVAPLFARLQPRIDAYNDGIRAVAARRGAGVVDFAAHATGSDRRIWSADRIHANAFGHSLIAAGFADTLGVPGFEFWTEPLPPADAVGRVDRLRTEARWLRTEVAPWLLRRARGRSSGDTVTAKRPRLVPVAPIFHLVPPADWPTTGMYRPPSLEQEGFVHFSFGDQVEGSANRHYAGAAELAAIEVDAAAVGADVAVEDSYGSGVAYPHVYGPVPVASALAVHPLRRTAAGWQFAPLTPAGGSAAASPGR